MPFGLGKSKTTVTASAGGNGYVSRIGVVDGAIGGEERLAAIAALFPHALFESAGLTWPERAPAHLDILIVIANALTLDEVVRRLRSAPPTPRVVVVLHNADVPSSRLLTRAGAADVLPYPVSEPAIALSLERLLSNETASAAGGRGSGEVVAFLKAGGGVGATCLAAQVAAQLAARGDDLVCLADLDVQFGAASVYLDLPEAMTLADLLAIGPAMIETPLATALAKHRSGARVLAAPRELMPLEGLTTPQLDALISGLRRDFALTLVDLPSVWTAWTHRLLSAADRIVLVTQLSVPHIQLVTKQLRVMASQNLQDRPVILVCNGLSADQQASVSLKAAERVLGRPFDVVIPEDRRTMTSAINQGVELSAIRGGTKIEKAIGELANKAAAEAVADAPARRWR